MPKSLDELSHAENWLNHRLQRQKSRINDLFGKKCCSVNYRTIVQDCPHDEERG